MNFENWDSGLDAIVEMIEANVVSKAIRDSGFSDDIECLIKLVK